MAVSDPTISVPTPTGTSATLNPADLANCTLSGGNLTATSGGVSDGGVRSTTSYATGKLYFEVTYNSGAAGLHDGCGILTPTQSLTTIGNGNGGFVFLYGNTWVYFNGSGSVQLGSNTAFGTVICFAIDLVNQQGWVRMNAGNWNASGTANPATNTGGISISGLFSSSAALAVIETANTGAAQSTINFGATNFAQTVPGGFSSWNPTVVTPGVDPSQPRWGVPTPTGTLQGAAAFSWDGSTWQPSGRSYASVATPTGVLRGVAPFSYSGGAWQPSGMSRPGVPTPTGTLDGVAIYTWSGSAWTPAGGAPDVPTPSGTLQGVAAFYWDGANWQPTGQAAPEVAIPGGVLAGMAMFSWGGSSWAPTVSGVAVDINFVNATSLDNRVTFTRASTATSSLYTDAAGTSYTTYATNQPRLLPNGLLIEETRINSLLNTDAPATQTTASLATGAYVLWTVGTGSAAVAAGTAVISAGGTATSGNPYSFNITTAGTVSVTVSGSLTRFQLEAGAFPTSYVPSTGTAGTRVADAATIASGTWRNSSAETFGVEFLLLTSQRANCSILADNATTHQISAVTSGLQAAAWDGTVVQTTNSLTIGATAKTATSWASPNSGNICLNGGAVASALQSSGWSSVATFRLMSDAGGTADSANGYMRRFRYWPRVLSTTEMQRVTT